MIGTFGLLTAQSSFLIPHAALGAELSPESADRTRLFASNGVIAALGSFAALTLGLGLLRTAEAPRTASITLCLGFALAVVLLCLAMVSYTREPVSHQGRGSASPFAAYLDVWRNPHARILILVNLFVHATYAVMGTVLMFALQYVMKIPEATELFMVSYFVPSLLSVPGWVALTRRFEKRHLWMVCLAISAGAFSLMGVAPEGVGLRWMLPIAAMTGLAGGGLFVFEPSIRAEVIDFDEYETGERKEGVYSAASHLVGKVAAAGITVCIGLALDLAGYVPNVEQTQAVKWVIRALLGALPAVAFLIALLLLSRFKLSEKVHAEIRASLDRRESDRTRS